MLAIAMILFVLSLTGILLGIVGVIKGSLKFLKLKSTKASVFFLLGSLVLFALSIIITPVDPEPSKDESVKTEVEENTSVKEEKQKEQADTKQPDQQDEEKSTEVSKVETPGGTLEVHFVDVGQGAAQVIVTPNKKVMVIDGGNNDDEDDMVAYLTQLGIKKVDILIGTHPDADHIGGIDAVIDSFEIGKIYLPKIQSNTQTFESVLQSIRNKGLKVTTAKAGIELPLDSAVQAEMIAPIGTTNDSNEMSAVVRLVYGENSFLLTGDAGLPSEQDMIASGEMLKSDVLLVGHHGSKHSTGEPFVQAVQPKYAVIQVGKNNYGHPEAEVLARLANAGAKIYRTDTDGTIVFKTDGKGIQVNKNAWTYEGPTESSPSTPVPPREKQPITEPTTTTSLQATASIDNATPSQNETVTVTVNVTDQDGKPVNGAKVSLNLQFKSTNTEYTGVTDANGTAALPFKIGRAAKGYTVNGEVTIIANGQTATAKTAFTPQ
ncbi:MAG: MBL fold metallo-hydrolase [Bacillus sp. (in: firmicutes)]